MAAWFYLRIIEPADERSLCTTLVESVIKHTALFTGIFRYLNYFSHTYPNYLIIWRLFEIQYC